MNILLVEDDTIAAMVAQELLTDQFACQVDIAKTGAEAVQLAQNKSYQYIFMDIGLPDISGFEVTRQIKADSQNRNTSIIALTGNTGSETKTESQAAGMSEIIEKPLTKTKLVTLFERISKNYRAKPTV